MGLFDTVKTAFTGGNNQPIAHVQGNAQQPAPNPNDRVQQNNPGADPNAVPGNNGSKPTVDPTISQLDQFGDLWKTPVADPKAVDPLTQPLLNYDATKFAVEARKMNFTAGIDPALVSKALGGDAQALMDVINHSTQNAFTAASQLSTNLVEGAAKTNNSRLTPLMQSKFKEFMLEQSRTDNAVMQHPSVAPMLDLAKRQLLAKHPEKTASEIHSLAEQYVQDFATAMSADTTRRTQQSSRPSNEPTDFSSWDNLG